MKLYLLVIALAFTACTGKSPQSSHQKEDHQVHSHDKSVDQHNRQGSAISLNNGEKWKADAGMVIQVEAMKNELAAFSGSDLEDYQVLGQALNDHTHQLIASCTMKGKGHDELHKWLHPLMEVNAKLMEAENLKTAEAATAELQESLAAFDHYFE